MGGKEEPRRERIAKNEAIFRAVNEVLRDDAEGGLIEVTCECGDRDCERILPMPAQVYERIRSDPLLFLVAEGHEAPDVEDVIERGDGFNIVRKHEDTRAIAEQLDPRGE